MAVLLAKARHYRLGRYATLAGMPVGALNLTPLLCLETSDEWLLEEEFDPALNLTPLLCFREEIKVCL